MNKTALSDLIDSFTFSKFGLTDEERYSTETIDAIDLLSPRRIDIVAKYMYLYFKLNHIKSDYAENIYKKHIDIFSDGRFSEPGSDTKKTYDDFLKEFEQIYRSIKKYGFDGEKSLIPVGNDGVIINGGHRVASSIMLGQEVKVVKIHNHPGPNYSCKYFERRQMPRDYLDFLALNYIKLSKNHTFAICLWPRAVNMNKTKECEELISNSTNIIYKKAIRLNKIGLKNLMMHLYQKEKWVGNEKKGNFVNVYGKLEDCYANTDTIVYFVEADSLNTIVNLKKQIRSIFKIDKHSVHITDTDDEISLAADLVLNPNCEFVMNCGYPDKLNPKLEKLRSEKKQYDKDEVVLNPLYTIQYFGHDVKIEGNDFCKVSELSRDVLLDTRNYFVYRGFKLLAPEYAMELSDKKHAQLFESVIKKRGISAKNKIKENLARTLFMSKRRVKRVAEKVGVLEFIYKIRGRND